MEPINVHSHLFPQVLIALAFGIALVAITMIAIVDQVATALRLAAANRESILVLRIASATAVPLTGAVGTVINPKDFAQAVHGNYPLGFRAGGVPVRTPWPGVVRATA